MIAFLMTAHQDPAVARGTIELLRPHPVFVHLDAKTAMTAEWTDLDAHLVTPRRPVFWAGSSQLAAILDLMRTALAEAPDATHLVLITGACYPLRPVAELDAFLTARPDVNHMACMEMPPDSDLAGHIGGRTWRDGLLPWRWVARSRLAFQLDRAARKGLTVASRVLPRRRWPAAFPPRYGNGNWAITRAAAQHLLDHADSPAGRRLLRFMRLTQSPDEIFLHSILAASDLPAARPPMEYVQYGNYLTANLHVIHPTLGKWYTIDDLDDLVGSGQFFVRKVRTADSAELMSALDRRIRDADGS